MLSCFSSNFYINDVFVSFNKHSGTSTLGELWEKGDIKIIELKIRSRMYLAETLKFTCMERDEPIQFTVHRYGPLKKFLKFRGRY